MTRQIHKMLDPRGKPLGFSLLSATALLGTILVFVIVLIYYIMSSRNAAKNYLASIDATQIADAGIQKAIFCLNATSGTNCGGSYGGSYTGETDIPIGNGSFTTVVSGSGSSRSIVSAGTTASGRTTQIAIEATTLPPSDETGFGYALQSGDGGAHLENNAVINGTLYTNGDVDCQTTQAQITGDVWISKAGGSVDDCTIGYHARADRVLNCDVGGDAYYQNDPADIAGSDVDGTKYPGSPVPDVEPMPSMDLQFWRDSAEAGGVIFGDYYPADDSDLGPVKITGNLILNNNVDVNIQGPVWVLGNITTNNGSSLTLDASWGANSTTLLADDPDDMVNHGYINVLNGTAVAGSGNPKSHLLLASTNQSMSDTVPAISVANTASGAVFYAMNGVMRLQANAGAKSLAAKRLFIDQNAVVTYIESELADMKFSNSPGGVWRVVEGSWREAK